MTSIPVDEQRTVHLLIRDLLTRADGPRDVHLASVRRQVALRNGALWIDPEAVRPRIGAIGQFLHERFGRKRDHHGAVVQTIASLRSRVRRALGVAREGRPIFVLRVDDFNWPGTRIEDFLTFHRVLRDAEVPYLLAVTPFLCEEPMNPQCRSYRAMDERDVRVLHQITAEGVELALHGFTHQTFRQEVPTEVNGLADTELEAKIEAGLKALELVELKADYFIPPFNQFEPGQATILGKHFRALCGGPESIKQVGFLPAPAALGGTLYLPSYYPAYGRAERVAAFARRVKRLRDHLLVPLTLHWHWEVETGFQGVRTLAEAVGGQAITWNEASHQWSPGDVSPKGSDTKNDERSYR